MCERWMWLFLFMFFPFLNYRPFHKTLPWSRPFVYWISVRFYETDCIKNMPISENLLEPHITPQKRVDVSTISKLGFPTSLCTCFSREKHVYSTSFQAWSKTGRKITWKTRLFGTTFRIFPKLVAKSREKTWLFGTTFKTGPKLDAIPHAKHVPSHSKK